MGKSPPDKTACRDLAGIERQQHPRTRNPREDIVCFNPKSKNVYARVKRPCLRVLATFKEYRERDHEGPALSPGTARVRDLPPHPGFPFRRNGDTARAYDRNPERPHPIGT